MIINNDKSIEQVAIENGVTVDDVKQSLLMLIETKPVHQRKLMYASLEVAYGIKPDK